MGPSTTVGQSVSIRSERHFVAACTLADDTAGGAFRLRTPMLPASTTPTAPSR